MRPRTFVLILAATASWAVPLIAKAHVGAPSTWNGSISAASPVCSVPAVTASPHWCPLDPASPMNNVFASAVSIPAHYRDGNHTIRLTGTIPPDVSGEAGRLSITFANPGDLVDGTIHPWPNGTSKIDILIPPGKSVMRVQPYFFRGLAQNVTWTLRVIG